MFDDKCLQCGDPYEVGVGGDPFTTIIVFHHGTERTGFSELFCEDCGDALLEDVYEVVGHV